MIDGRSEVWSIAVIVLKLLPITLEEYNQIIEELNKAKLRKLK